MLSEFIRIHNRVVRLESIAYVDFLDSGRAMVFMRGLNQEKQNIPVDVDEARRLREFFDARVTPLEAAVKGFGRGEGRALAAGFAQA